MATKQSNSKVTKQSPTSAKKSEDKEKQDTSVSNAKSSPPKTKSPQDAPEQKSARRTINLFTILILLLIAGGIYMNQKGYLDRFRGKILKNSTVVTTQNTPYADAPTITSPNTPNSPQVSTAPSSQDSLEQESASQAMGPELDVEDTVSNTQPSQELEAKDTSQDTSREALEDRITKLEATVSTLTQQLDRATSAEGSSSNVNRQVEQTKLLSALILLEQKIAQSLPFKRELAAIKAFNISDLDAKVLSDLEQLAPIGIPSQDYLIRSYRPLGEKRDKAKAFANADSMKDKAKIFLSQLVTVRKVSPTTVAQENTPNPENLSPSHRHILAMRQGNFEPAISELERAETLSDEESLWLQHAKAYVLGQNALETIKATIQ